MNDHQKLDRATKAKRIIEDEMFQEAFEQQERDIVKLWKDSIGQGPEFRERLWYQHQALVGAQEHLKRILGDGKSAESRIKKDTKTQTKRG